MIKQIEELTEEQEQLIPVYRENWRKIGLNTEAIDRVKAEAAVKNLYKAANQGEPIVLFFDSPAACLIARAILRNMGEHIKDGLDKLLWQPLRQKLIGMLGRQARENIDSDLLGYLEEQIEGQLDEQFDEQLNSNLNLLLDSQFVDQLSPEEQLTNQLRSKLKLNLSLQNMEQLGEQLWKKISSHMFGQLWHPAGEQVSDHLAEQFGNRIDDQFGEGLKTQLWRQLEQQFGVQLRRHLWRNILENIASQFGGQAKERISDQLWQQFGNPPETNNIGQLGEQIFEELAGQILKPLWGQAGEQFSEKLREYLWDEIWDELTNSLSTKIGSQLEEQLVAQIESQTTEPPTSQQVEQLDPRIRLNGQVPDQLNYHLNNQLWEHIGYKIWDPEQIKDHLWDHLAEQIGGELKDVYDTLWFAGGWDAYWIAFYKFAQEIGAKFDNQEHLDAYVEYAQSCGIMYAYKGFAFVSDRPEVLKFDERRLLHCEDGYAVKFRDGYGFCAWHGTRVPENWILDKKNLDVKTALTHENLEQRRAASEIIGWNRVLKELNAKTINLDPNPEIGELLQVDIPDIGREKFLRVRCGTGREFALPVPPNMKTARQANAWTYGLSEADYKPEIRT